MLPAVLIAFFGSQAILEQHHILQISFSHPGVARAVIGGALYLTVVGVFALSMGAITRNTAGGIAVFAGIFFVIPPLMNILPTSWNDAISEYLPEQCRRATSSRSPTAPTTSRPAPASGSSAPTPRSRSRSRRCCSSAATPERQPPCGADREIRRKVRDAPANPATTAIPSRVAPVRVPPTARHVSLVSTSQTTASTTMTGAGGTPNDRL